MLITLRLLAVKYLYFLPKLIIIIPGIVILLYFNPPLLLRIYNSFQPDRSEYLITLMYLQNMR